MIVSTESRHPALQAVLGGGIAPLLSAAISFGLVWGIAIPAFENYLSLRGPSAEPPEAAWWKQYYDPHTDHTFNLQALGGILGYVGMSSLCTFLDVLTWALGCADQVKVQGERSLFTPREWGTAVCTSFANMAFFSWFATASQASSQDFCYLLTNRSKERQTRLQTRALLIFPSLFHVNAYQVPAWYLLKGGFLRGGHPMIAHTAPWELGPALAHTAVHGLFIDFWFYSTHRLLHWPPLFKAVHKLHHRFHAPTAVSSM